MATRTDVAQAIDRVRGKNAFQSATAWVPNRSPTGHATAFQVFKTDGDWLTDGGDPYYDDGDLPLCSSEDEAIEAARKRWRCND